MINGLVVADAGPIFSLAIIDKLELLDKIFSEVKIPKAVWEEITRYKNEKFYNKLSYFLNQKLQIFRDLTN